MNIQLCRFERQFNVSTLTQLPDPWLRQQGIEVWIKRDDRLHPVISGNKWRKLKYILDQILSDSLDTVISMGGAYSNHLHALAYAGMKLGFKTAAFIRGEAVYPLNPTLQDVRQWGMRLNFVSRGAYRELRNYRECTDLPGLEHEQYWLPEGGALPLALLGVREIVAEIDCDYDVLCVPCGSGTTLAGIIGAVPENKRVIGFSALKGGAFLEHEVLRLAGTNLPDGLQWSINQDYHFGGFARIKPQLLSFIRHFEEINRIPLEPVYTGKMFYGIYDLISKNYFEPGQRIIAIHTGGLQGKRGFS